MKTTKKTMHININIAIVKGKLVEPKDWKGKCHKEKRWCANFLEHMKKEKDGMKILYGKKVPKELPKKVKSKIERGCKKRWAKAKKHKKEGIRTCITQGILMKQFKISEGGGGKRSANEGTAASSNGATLWIGLGALGLILLFAAIAAYWFLFSGKTGKGGLAKGTSKASKSKVGGKSRIVSRLGSKKSAKRSRRSKSRHSKGSKGSLKK